MSEESKGKIEKKNDEDLEKVSGGFMYMRMYAYNTTGHGDECKGDESFAFTEEEKKALINAGYTFCEQELSKDHPELRAIRSVIDKSGNKVTPEQIIEFLKETGCQSFKS